MLDTDKTLEELRRIADALERLAPPRSQSLDVSAADAFVWNAEREDLVAIHDVASLPLSLLVGVDRARDTLLQNTKQFAAGFSANNALLWGARGQGKSSLVKAIHAHINQSMANSALKLVEIHREDLHALPQLMARLRQVPQRIILFCDDLSFDAGETTYKSLKAALEGGVEGRPANVLFYATSNRRHLLPRDMMDNERATAINPGDAVEEKVSLSDRFGLWLGFHKCSQDEYLDMVETYADHFDLSVDPNELRAEALSWSTTRGDRSGRVAWQFIQDQAGKAGKSLG